MEVHVLNGDALAEKFPMAGEVIICRECLMDGPASEADETNFWQQRARFIAGELYSSQDEYDHLVTREFDRLKRIQPNVINLWFEHDLFCQVNLWFTIDFISRNLPAAAIFVVSPNPHHDPTWSGFGPMAKHDLQSCYEARVCVNATEKQLARALWTAFRNNDRIKLDMLSSTDSLCFPKLREVCNAHFERNPIAGIGRPQQTLMTIITTGETDFLSIFKKFRATEGIYGYGDLQVKKMLSEIANSSAQ